MAWDMSAMPSNHHLEALVSDILSPAASLEDLCERCKQPAKVVARCADCKEVVCDPCLQSHATDATTKDHRIHYLIAPVIIPNNVHPLTYRLNPSDRPVSIFGSLCQKHEQANVMYCCDCYQPVCNVCALEEHRPHTMIYLYASENTTIDLSGMLEASHELDHLQKAMNNLKTISSNLGSNFQTVTKDINGTFNAYIKALEMRRTVLIAEAEASFNFKLQRIKTQYQALEQIERRLNGVMDVIGRWAEGQTIPRNEYLFANELCKHELKKLKRRDVPLRPCDNDAMHFRLYDQIFLEYIAFMGDIDVGPAYDRNQLALSKNQQSMKLKKIFQAFKEIVVSPPSFLFACRPIFGVPHQVGVRSTSASPTVVGKNGTEDGNFCRPWGVCCSYLGEIFVVDRSNDRIQVFNPSGEFLYKFGTPGHNLGQLHRPAGITISPYNQVIVADKDNHRIQVFRTDGVFLFAFGQKGSGDGEFHYPWDVACNAQGDIVVSDSRNHRVQLFTATGVFLRKYGFEGDSSKWKHFDSPRGVCFTPEGKIMVTDFNNHKVLLLGSGGEESFCLGREDERENMLLRPQGIICDDFGNIILADSKNHRLLVFDKRGKLKTAIGKQGTAPGEFHRPTGVCISPRGDIIVVDYENSRLQLL